jgi:outer membrane protein assembly factor BamB
VVWQKDLMKEYGIPQYFFGYGPTPLVHGERLLVNVGGRPEGEAEGVCVAAFDKKTGKVLWEVKDEWGASYASPVTATLHGKPCVLVLGGGESKPSKGGLLTIDVQTGKVYDRFPWRARKYESVLASSPLVVADDQVFISDCYEKGGALLKYDENLRTTPVWTQREFGMHFMMPLRKDGYLYGFAGRNPPDTEFKCVDLKTGELMWTKTYQWKVDGWVEGLFRASLLQAGGRFLALGEDGVFVELDLSPEGSKELQRTRLFTAREAWTLPSLHRGLLYVVQNSTDEKTGEKPRILCYDLLPE